MTVLGSGSGYWDTPIFNAQIPKEGPKALAIQAPFTSTFVTALIDLQQTQASKKITAIQSVFVDNWNNPAPVSIAVDTVNQTIEVPAFSQGYFPILAPMPSRFNVSSFGQVNVTFIFLNVPVPAMVWTDPSKLMPHNSAGALIVSQTAPAQVAPVGGASFSIVAGGVAQNAVAPGAVLNGGYIRNPKNATESLFVDPVNPAQAIQGGGTFGTTLELAAGETYYLQPSIKPYSVAAVTVSHAFIVVTF